jgi:hypothetical protein
VYQIKVFFVIFSGLTPNKDVLGCGENNKGISFTFGAEVVAKFLHNHDLYLICRFHHMVVDMNFLQRGSGSLCFLHSIIVESLAMQVS